jgi:Asp-tRNA(Asn)/Glu-tRNA(Gln) amidotransferase A subunit family amidase
MAGVLKTGVALTIAIAVAGCATTARQAVDPSALGVAEAAKAIRDKQVTSTQLTQAALDRAEANAALNAFVTIDRTGALLAARDADTELANGKVKGPLHGVPLVVKDNIHVKGLPNTAGTPALRGFVPQQNAPTVQRLVDAGAIILGKTNLHELAFGISGYNQATFSAEPIGVRNPYDRNRFAGGSSSGTAAAIAAGIVPGGLGSDTGGSSRIPSAVTGGAGFRPTIGRYDNSAVTPISHTRDTVGPMARTVADVALLDAVLTAATVPAAASLKGVKLGVYRAYFFKNLDADTTAVMDATLEKLKKAGATVVEVDMPDLQKHHGNASFPIALYEAHEDMVRYLEKYGTRQSIESLASMIVSEDVKGTYNGLVVPRKLPTPDGLIDAAPVYEAAMKQARPALIQHYADTFKKYGIDALVAPTTPHVAEVQGPDASKLETFLLFIQNTDPGSVAGIPGLSIPAGLGPTTRLPVGIAIDGPSGSDQKLLAIGMAIEKVLGPTPRAMP